jgi:hypothetical protein
MYDYTCVVIQPNTNLEVLPEYYSDSLLLFQLVLLLYE